MSEIATKGNRLKYIRNLVNLSRKDFCLRFDLNFHTYKSWELDKMSGLSVQASEKISALVHDLGVIVHPDWLITGNGMKPYLVNQEIQDISQGQLNREIEIFTHSASNISLYTINDDAMLPYLKVGDIVGAVMYQNHSIVEKMDKELCLIDLKNNHRICRLFNHPGKFIANNLDSMDTNLVVALNDVVSIGVVKRIYKV